MSQGAAGAGSPPLGRSVGSTGTSDTVGVRVGGIMPSAARLVWECPSLQPHAVSGCGWHLAILPRPSAMHRARKPLACHGNDRSGLLAGAAMAASAAAYALVHEKLPGG